MKANYARNYGKWIVFVQCGLCGAEGKKTSCEREDDPKKSNWSNTACYSAAAGWNSRVLNLTATGSNNSR